jgi:hypothetical protein
MEAGESQEKNDDRIVQAKLNARTQTGVAYDGQKTETA